MNHVATIRKNAREEIRVSLDKLHGLTLANVRVWYDADGEMRPGKQGIALRPELLSQLIVALTKAAESVKVTL